MTTAPGVLANEGEQLTFVLNNQLLFSFMYGDDSLPGWPDTPDGDGPSLVNVDVTANTARWSNPAQWRPSAADGGSPGAPEPGELPPQAVPDAAFDAGLTISFTGGLLAEAVDFDDQPLTVMLVSDAVHGHVVIQPDGTFTYTPDRNFFGEDRFMFAAVDNDSAGPLSSPPTMVTIVVRPDSTTTTCEDLDWNQSGVVDAGDLAGLMTRFGATVTPGAEADFNGDGVVGVRDLLPLQAALRSSCAAPPPAPSPTAVVSARPSAIDAALAQTTQLARRAVQRVAERSISRHVQAVDAVHSPTLRAARSRRSVSATRDEAPAS